MVKKEFEEIVLEKLSNIETDVSVLKTDVSGLKDDVSVLKTDVSGLKDDVSILKHKVDVLDNRTLITDKKIDGLYEKNDELQDSINLNARYINQSFMKIAENSFK